MLAQEGSWVNLHMKLSCFDLSYSVGQGRGQVRKLFSELSIQIETSRLTGMIGPNGSGKSSLLRLLLALSPLQDGKVMLDGMELRQMKLRERSKKLAYLPQNYRIPYDLCAFDVALLGRAPYGAFFGPKNKEKDRKIVQKSLAMVGLLGYERRYLSSLSGGELQRVMLARMLATEAPLLFIDEAITALDIGHSLAFLELCAFLCRKQGKGIVLSIHQLDLAWRYCDMILLLGAPNSRSWLYGRRKEVMQKENLEAVFQVKVEEKRGELYFSCSEELIAKTIYAF